MDTFTTRPFLLASGLSSDEVRRALRDGDLTPVRRGAYLTGPPPEFADARHLLLLRAAREHLIPEAVVSHVSAALVHGIDLWRSPMDRVHVTRRRAYGGRRGARVHVHVAPLDPDETTFVDGVLVTSPARTVVDIAGPSRSSRLSWPRTSRCAEVWSTVTSSSMLRHGRRAGQGFRQLAGSSRSPTAAARTSGSRAVGSGRPRPDCCPTSSSGTSSAPAAGSSRRRTSRGSPARIRRAFSSRTR